MPNLRPILLISLVFLGYLLWVEWQKDYGPQPGSVPAATPTVSEGSTEQLSIPEMGDLPELTDAAQANQTSGDLPQQPVAPEGQQGLQAAARQLISVTTDVLKLEIDPVGGSVVSAQLLNYPVDLDMPDVKVQLLTEGPGRYAVAQSGLLSAQTAPNHTTRYISESRDYTLADGQDQIEIPLRWSDPQGVEVVKTFVLQRGEYHIAVNHQLRNNTGAVWSGSRYLQLQKAPPGEGEGGTSFNNPESYSFDGVGFYSPEEKLDKIDFEDVEEDAFRMTTKEGWAAMIQHYFFCVDSPAEETNNYSAEVFRPTGGERVIARAVAPVVSVPAGQGHEFQSTLYIGPKIQDHLSDIAQGLDLTVNYGIFTVFSAPLFWLLSKIHDFVGNWGWSIVLLTVLIKLAFFKLTEAQYRSMARMRKLQPRIEKLKERYGDDRQAMSQAMMKMYKEEKVNPLGGCLPILVQIPIFIALYWVLLESVELRQAPFILWIDNLSVRDPYFILPILNAAFMFATQRLTPMVGMDPLQQKMMQAMPLVFAVMFAFFPAGLVLYWATNAGLSLAQQWYITRKIAAED